MEGHNSIGQILDHAPDQLIEILSEDPAPRAYPKHLIQVATPKQFQSISLTRSPQGILAMMRLPHDAETDHLPKKIGNKILVLEDIQDPGNVGTLIRTASAFNFSGVILSNKCADPYSPKCVQSTAGSILSVWIRRTSRYLECTERLQKTGFNFIIADLSGEADASILIGQVRLLLGLGNEAAGPSKALVRTSDARIKIPIARKKAESLNVASSGAICMYLSSHPLSLSR